jgi:hypothetical protein
LPLTLYLVVRLFRIVAMLNALVVARAASKSGMWIPR